jgi:hypothetical protein
MAISIFAAQLTINVLWSWAWQAYRQSYGRERHMELEWVNMERKMESQLVMPDRLK